MCPEFPVLDAHKELILGGEEVPWPVRSVKVGLRCGYSFQIELYASSPIASVRCLISVGPLLIFLPDGDFEYVTREEATFSVPFREALV
jgi:hypothetical protein